MEDLPSAEGSLTKDERRQLKEAFDEWLIDDATPHVAS